MEFKRLINAIKREIKKKRLEKQWYRKSLPIQISKEQERKMIELGFYPSSILFFDFEKYKPNQYLCEKDYKKLYPLNHPVISNLLDNKAYLPLIFENHPEWLPDFYTFISKGKIIYSRSMTPDSFEPIQLIKSAVKRYGRVIAKPTTDGGGRRVFLIDEANLELEGKEILKGDWLIINCLENDHILKEIYPHSLNTMRVVFFKNQKRENKILMIGQRFGTSKSNHVDNISSGGIGYTVDIESGAFSRPYSFMIPESPNQFDRHMDTGFHLKEFIFPDWESRLREIKEIVDSLDYVDYAGLDLAFTSSGIKIIEINSHPESIYTQIDKPVFLNQEFKDFIQSRGYDPTRR
jgi:hypothetical protein